MAQLTFNPRTTDGLVRILNNTYTVWANARGASTGEGTNASTWVRTRKDGSYYKIARAFLVFDTSAIPAGAVVTASTLTLRRDDSIPGAFSDTDSTSLELVTNTQASPTSLTTADFNQVGFVSKGSVNFSATTNGQDFTITNSDQSLINISGNTQLAIITGRDQGNNAPTGDNLLGWQDSEDVNPPELSVTYTPPTGNFFLLL